MKINTLCCARCGKIHKNIEAYELTNPIEKTIEEIDYGERGGYYTETWRVDRWAMCPTLKQPILITSEATVGE